MNIFFYFKFSPTSQIPQKLLYVWISLFLGFTKSHPHQFQQNDISSPGVLFQNPFDGTVVQDLVSSLLHPGKGRYNKLQKNRCQIELSMTKTLFFDDLLVPKSVQPVAYHYLHISLRNEWKTLPQSTHTLPAWCPVKIWLKFFSSR